MKSVLLLLSICAGFFAAAQQSAIDSIEKIIQRQRDTVQVASYNELTWLYRKIDSRKAIASGQKAIALSEPLGYQKGIAQAYNDLGIIYYDQGSYDTARLFYQKALSIRSRLKDDVGMAKLYNKLAIIDQEQGHFAPALEANFKALAIFEKNQIQQGVSYSLGNIGVLQQNLGRFDEALKYQQKSYSIKISLGDKSGAAASLINMGNIYLIQKKFDKAADIYAKGIALCRSLGDTMYLAKSLNNLANLYRKEGKMTLAESYVREALTLRQAIRDSKGTVSSMEILASIFTSGQRFREADSLLNRALQVSYGTTNASAERSSVFQAQSLLYEQTKQPDLALAAYKNYAATKDSLYTDDASKKYAELEVAYRTLESENTVSNQRYELARRNLLLSLSLGILAVVTVLAYMLIRLNRGRARARLKEEVLRQQALASQAIVEAEEEQRSRIAGDLHDGVGQLMSAAKMNLSSIEQSIQFQQAGQQQYFVRALEQLDEACAEVRTVSHLLMPGNLTTTRLDKAVTHFLQQSLPADIQLQMHASGFVDGHANGKAEFVVYRIVQECVNNVVKHARATQLQCTMDKSAEGLTITLEDNGQGFDVAAGKQKGGLGLSHMEQRMQSIGGEIEWDSQPGKGTVVSLFVPASARLS